MLLFDALLYSKQRGLGVFVREVSRCLNSDIVAQDWRVLTKTPIADIPSENQIVVRWRGGQVSWEQLVVPWYAWRMNANAVHAPANSFGLVFVLLRTIVILTVHDLMFLEGSGGSLNQRLGNLYRSLCYRALPFCSKRVTTVSEASRKLIERSLGNTVNLTSNSCEYVLEMQSQDDRNYAISGSPSGCCFVHIGGRTANKNTRRVISAWQQAKLSANDRLVLLGDTAEGFAASFPEVKSISSIETPGFISDQDLVQRIGRCTALIFPSLQEGFGLPIVEAAFLGVPVITSNRPPMNELAPECCLLVDPESTEGISSGIRRLANEPELRQRLSIETMRVRSRFSRERLAESLRQVYETVL